MGGPLTAPVCTASAPVPGDVKHRWGAEGSTECRGSCKGVGAPRPSGGAPLNLPSEDKADGPWGGRGGLQFTNRKKVASTSEVTQQENRLTRKDIAEVCDRFGWHKLAEKLKDCGEKVYTFRCRSCDTKWEAPSRCHHRLCPDCAPIRAQVLFDRHSRLMSTPNLKHLVFTVQTSSHIDRAYVKSLVAAFNKLRRKVFYRHSWRGGVRQVEFVYTPQGAWEFDHKKHKFFHKTPGWHVHIHCLIDGKYVPQAKIAKDWQQVTKGQGTIIWIERAKNPMQALKYVLKPDSELLETGEAFYDLLDAIQSLHLVAGFGAYWKVKGERPPLMGRLCPACGCSSVEYLGARFLWLHEHQQGARVLPARAPPPEYQLAFNDPGQRRLF